MHISWTVRGFDLSISSNVLEKLSGASSVHVQRSLRIHTQKGQRGESQKSRGQLPRLQFEQPTKDYITEKIVTRQTNREIMRFPLRAGRRSALRSNSASRRREKSRDIHFMPDRSRHKMNVTSLACDWLS